MSCPHPHVVRKMPHLPRLIILVALLASSLGQAASLERTSVPAQGQQQSLVNIEQFGRYAITVKSGQGTALQLIDHMAGPGSVSGSAGEHDGRLDLFLDRGQYKLLTFAHDKGEGEAALGLHAFSELNAHPAPRLIEHRLVSEALGDFQQRSYWLDIQSRQTVLIEAAGRSLADIRLWRDGNWLIDAQPEHEELTPKPGQPLNGLSLVATLEPGLYLLTAYGGQPNDWAESSDAQPFYLRLGIPKLGSVGRQYYTASPFGRDRWLVPASANYFRLELPQAEDASIEVGHYREQQPLSPSASRVGSIDKKSIPPVTELDTSAGEGWQLVTIEREAGKPYVLQHLNRDNSYTLSDTGRYWVSTIQSGYGEDVADATALVVKYSRYGKRSLFWSDTIELDHSTGWQRRFNLLGENTLYLEVKERGAYTFAAEGVVAQLRVEPFLTERPQHYRTPDFRAGSWEQTLDAGFYVLTLRPGSGSDSRGKGIVNLSITAQGRGGKPAVAQTSVNLPVLTVGSNDSYTIYSNPRAGVTGGMVVRALPLDMHDPLPVTLAVGEAVEVELTIPDAGTLQLIAEDGQRQVFQIGDRLPADSFVVAAGNYRAKLQNRGEHANSYSLQWLPTRLAAETPLPAVSPQRLAALPNFPVLKAGKERFQDVERQQRSTFNVSVDKPGLYRLESTGLLHTQGNLRTRVITSLAKADANGVGRNFLIARYLREGDYQLTTQPQGKSRGDMGLRLSPTTLHDGGALEPGAVARYGLDAGEGLVYRFTLAQEGDYRVRSLDLYGNVRFRLEDAQGWPLIRPGVSNDVTRHLRPGGYRLVVLPQAVETRVNTLLEQVHEPVAFEGHGPHKIAVQGEVQHTWYEPQDGKSRVPDRWQFTLPAEATLHIELSEGMKATLGGKGFTPETVYGSKAWQKKLPTGDYELAVTSLRADNGRDYTLRLRPDELLVGTTRDLRAPGNYIVALGDEQPFEIASFGNRDVRAALYDEQGRRLVTNDDRLNDWNFLLATQLPKGQYRLNIAPVSSTSVTTEVSIRTPQQRMEKALALPATLTVSDALMHYYPLQPGDDGGLLLFSASAADSVGLALERLEGGQWHSLGSRTGKRVLIAAPLQEDKDASYRLRVWSVSGRSLPVTVKGLRLDADTEDEEALADGLKLEPVEGLALPVGVASVEVEERGSLRLAQSDPLLEWGSAFDTVLAGNGRGYIDASEGVLWLVRALDVDAGVRVKAQRLRIEPGDELAMIVDPVTTTSLNLADIPWLRGNSQLLLATSTVGQPGLRLEGVDSNPVYSASDQQSVLLRHDNAASLVTIRGDVALPNPIPVRLSVHTFTREDSVDAHSGSNDLTLAAQGILYIALPEKASAVQLALPAGVAAELIQDERTVRTLWSGQQARSFSVDLKADVVRLYNTNTNERQASVVVRPLQETLVADGAYPLSRRFPGAGIWVVPIKLSAAQRREGRIVQLAGAQRGALAVLADGTVLSGESIRLNNDAVLYINHASGTVVAWLAREDGTTELHPQRMVGAAMGRNPLSGTSMGLRYNGKAMTGLSLSANATVLVQVRGSSGREWLSLQEQGADLTLYLPTGENLIALYGVDGVLDGDAYLQEQAVQTLHEGIGAPALLPPGGSRLYRFSLAQATTVGLGVNASLDTVNSVLLDAQGQVLGEGLVQMPKLEAGDYLFRIEAPADGQTVNVRPVLVGTELPTDGAPPAEVVRGYLKQAGLKMQE